MKNPYMHENFVPAYQISGVPYVTASSIAAAAPVTELVFPYVTRSITIQNKNAIAGQTLAVGFTSLGLTSTSNFFIVKPGADFISDVKIDRLYLSNSDGGVSIGYTVFAGLTSIAPSNFTIVTGSNGYAGVG